MTLVMQGEQKVTQMILDVAAQFIELVESEEERQTRLDIACAAWNISILPKHKRDKKYKQSINGIKAQVNNDKIMEQFKKNLDGLIAAKMGLFPNEKRPIVSARIENMVSNKYIVIASFARVKHH